jgi:hypothetical protein
MIYYIANSNNQNCGIFYDLGQTKHVHTYYIIFELRGRPISPATNFDYEFKFVYTESLNYTYGTTCIVQPLSVGIPNQQDS